MKARNLGSGWRKVAALFVVSGLATGLAVVPRTGLAAWRRHPASTCFTVSGDQTVVGWSGAIENSSGAASTTVFCPVVDESNDSGAGTFTKASTTSLVVYGHDGHGSQGVAIKACVTYRWRSGGVGGACGTEATTDGQTNYARSVTTGEWTSWTESDYGYLAITLPPYDNESNSSVRGYYIAN